MNPPPWADRLGLDQLRGSAVVVAVSGGGDSVGLLRALLALKEGFDLRLSVAHLDHGSRGEESRADARFVAELAASFALPFDLGHWQPTRANHFEAEARRARYEWLAGVAKARGAGSVAVGQTLDDQAETILHRVARGTGLRGLAGIPARRRLAPGVALIRPLLDVSRREVRDYLAAIGQDFREDSTNHDTSRTRARIRLELLPSLARGINPDVAGALVRLGRIAGEANRSLERVAADRIDALTAERGPDHLALDRPGFAKLDGPGRVEVLRLAWRRLGWPERAMDHRRWRRLAALDWAKLSVGHGVEAEATADRLTLRRPPTPLDRPLRAALPSPGRATWGGVQIEASFDVSGAWDERVDLDGLALPLTIRGAEDGDRFEPLGLGGRGQPLNDFFRGRRVGKADRGAVPLVCDASGIVWVVGHRIAHRARLTGSTRRVLALRASAAPADEA